MACVAACVAAAPLGGCGGGAGVEQCLRQRGYRRGADGGFNPRRRHRPRPVVIDPTPAVVIPRAGRRHHRQPFGPPPQASCKTSTGGSMVITTDGKRLVQRQPGAERDRPHDGRPAWSRTPVTGAAAGSSVSVGPLMLASDGKIWFCDPSGGSALQGAITSIVPATGVSVSYQPTGPIPLAGTHPTPSGITRGRAGPTRSRRAATASSGSAN